MKILKMMVVATMLLLTANTNSFASDNTVDELETIEIKVKGITCAMEPGNIAKAVKKIDGVESCELKGKAKAKSVFIVKYDPSKVTLKQIYKAVEGTESCDYPGEMPYTVIR